MKKFLAIFLVLVIVVSFVACSTAPQSQNDTYNDKAEIIYADDLKITHIDIVGDETGSEPKCYVSLVSEEIVLFVQIDEIAYAKLKEGDSIHVSVNKHSRVKFDGFNDWFHIRKQSGLDN